MARDFQAVKPAERWVSDLTCIKTEEGWLYLTIVLDLADRKVVGWALGETMEAEATTVAAFQMAIKNRPLFCSLLFNSDQGVLTPAVPSESNWRGCRWCKV
nr:DDE-type integrase/transposase/recombinase [Pontibacter harenae]